MRHCDAVVKELLARADEPGSTPMIFVATTFFHLVSLKQLPMVLTPSLTFQLSSGMHCRTFFVLVFFADSTQTQRHFNHPTAVSDHLSLPYHSIKDIELILLELINSDRPAKDF